MAPSRLRRKGAALEASREELRAAAERPAFVRLSCGAPAAGPVLRPGPGSGALVWVPPPGVPRSGLPSCDREAPPLAGAEPALLGAATRGGRGGQGRHGPGRRQREGTRPGRTRERAGAGKAAPAGETPPASGSAGSGRPEGRRRGREPPGERDARCSS